MNPAVLCVDDQPEMLAAYRRFLGPMFDVKTAESGAKALAVLAERGPFAVIVSDLQMQGMDGIQLLTAAREKYPDTVRMLVTGQADLGHAVQAVNDGYVFQFLTKPCSPAAFSTAVAAAAAQHQLIVSDRRRIESVLRASEERYRQLFNASPHPMWVIEADDARFLEVNEAAVRHYGYTRADFLGRTVQTIEVADQPTTVIGPGVHLCHHRLASGDVRQMEVATSPIEFGGRAGSLSLVVDVTERKLLETQLRQAQKLESIGQLAAGVAHEINTPIQYIGDNTTFLAGVFRDLGAVLARYRAARTDPALLAEAGKTDDESDLEYLLEEAPRAIAQTLAGVEHVSRIVKAMKEFAHPGTEEKVSVDLNHTLETVIAVARNEWKYTAEVVTDLDPDLPAVPGLPGELNQVFLNLLVNAVHAIQAGGTEKGTIRLSTRRAGNAIEVRVADGGCGIPQTIAGRVFDPFFTTKPVGQGTGQGLALAHAVVVQRHAGAITFESEVGKGTTFIVRLPVHDNRVTQSVRVKAAATLRVLPPNAVAGEPA